MVHLLYRSSGSLGESRKKIDEEGHFVLLNNKGGFVARTLYFAASQQQKKRNNYWIVDKVEIIQTGLMRKRRRRCN